MFSGGGLLSADWLRELSGRSRFAAVAVAAISPPPPLTGSKQPRGGKATPPPESREAGAELGLVAARPNAEAGFRRERRSRPRRTRDIYLLICP
ncbi:hypothetical protein Afe04nite_54630 [Asanoa ferruginea]|nr:hypothetical protein Afe04nite_54630 [Asanoa ferruginea]